MHQPGAQQLADQKAGAAGSLKMIHVGAAVGIDARQQRHGARQIAEVVPVDRDAGSARDRHQVNRVIGGTSGCQQADDGVDDRTLIDGAGQRQIMRSERADRADSLGRGARQRVAQRRVGRNERRTRQMQAHDFHQHLVAVRGAVEGAGAGRVVAASLGLEQLLAVGLALRIELAHARLLLVGNAGGHRATGHEHHRQMAEGQRADQQSGHDLVAHTETQRGVEHVVRQRHRGGHRDHIAAEQRQFHARQALGDAVAHRRHAAGELRHRTSLARRHLDQRRKALQRLMRRQHVVVRRYNGNVGPDQATQCFFIARAGGREAVRDIGAAEAAACGPAAARRLHAAEVLVPAVFDCASGCARSPPRRADRGPPWEISDGSLVRYVHGLSSGI